MPSPIVDVDRYTNPILDRDVPDPDAIALSQGGFALVASSFDRAPGLPLWRSDDLVSWERVGSAGGYRPDAPHDGGVWAPSIREHDGRLHITWGDPDLGVFVVDAERLEGPWSEPRLVRAGRGLIDACPLWDTDGRTWIVHGYARSRAGFANRIDAFEVDTALTRATGEARLLIDGDGIEGCSVLEGPKVYHRGGELWIFAPAGGVATGWQYVFRAPELTGPWEHRTVLEQGATAINGPHQGAWVAAGDEDWFLHFQHKGHLGRVLHLQPLRWGADGWPELGEPARPGEPVLSAPRPLGAGTPTAEPQGDSFDGPVLSPVWHTRRGVIDDVVSEVSDGRLTLTGGDGAILRPLDGTTRAIEIVALGGDAAAALVLSDAKTYELHWTAPADGGSGRVEFVGGADVVALETSALAPRLGLRFEGPRAWFTLDGTDLAGPIELTGRRWTGTEWGLAARGTGSTAFGPVIAR